MRTVVFGEDTLYSLDLTDGTLVVTLKGCSDRGALASWFAVLPSFSAQIERIIRRHKVGKVEFQGDHFGECLFSLCRLDLQQTLKGKLDKKYKLCEESKMKILYIEDSIFCTNRFAEECCGGLKIEVNAPLDTAFVFKRGDGETYETKIKDGIVEVPAEFLKDGTILVFAERPNGLPTNVLKMNIVSRKTGKYASCAEDYNTLLDAVYKILEAFGKTEKRLSAHIDGYDVV